MKETKVSKNFKETSSFGRELLKQQGNIDPITGLRITSPVVDHDHNTGHIRAVLQREVNSFEGKVINAYNRYIRHLGVPLEVALNGIIDYNKKNYNSNPIHHTEITKKANRICLHLTSQKQKDLILNYVPQAQVKNVKSRKKHIRKLLQEGFLWDVL